MMVSNKTEAKRIHEAQSGDGETDCNDTDGEIGEELVAELGRELENEDREV